VPASACLSMSMPKKRNACIQTAQNKEDIHLELISDCTSIGKLLNFSKTSSPEETGRE
jgi:hypothetical protein